MVRSKPIFKSEKFFCNSLWIQGYNKLTIKDPIKCRENYAKHICGSQLQSIQPR